MLEASDQYVAAASCLQCAGACAMRAFRLQQRECASALARLQRGTEGGGEAAAGPAGGKAKKRDEGLGQAELLEQLGRACASLEDFDKGSKYVRAMVKQDANNTNPGRQELLRKLPSLESFAAMSTQELIDAMQAVAAVLAKLSDATDGR